MRFPRNARILRSQLDAAPFAAVFFLLVMFMMLGSLIYTPGARVELQLPHADGLAGTDKPTVSVAIDADGRLYYENQWIEEKALRRPVAGGGQQIIGAADAGRAGRQERLPTNG